MQNDVRDLAASKYTGVNRRAIHLIPLPVGADSHEIAQTAAVRYHHLLISIEGNQRTCCLKIVSPKKRSRCALLVYRGRVVGALYGRKGWDVCFNSDAHAKALSDLASPGNILDAYQLPDELVLASAALFHGQILEFNKSFSAAQTYESAVQQIMSFGMPGCVVINNGDNELIAMVYIANGRIIGVFSSNDGWVETSQQAGARYISGLKDPRITGSILSIRDEEDLLRMSWSLSGLGDRQYERWKSSVPVETPYTLSNEFWGRAPALKIRTGERPVHPPSHRHPAKANRHGHVIAP